MATKILRILFFIFPLIIFIPAYRVIADTVSPSVDSLPVVSPDSDIFVKVEIDHKEVVPNQPIYLKYDLYTRYDTRFEGFSKEGAFRGFWLESEEPIRQVDRDVVEIDGKKFVRATVKKMILFSMDSGKKTIDPGTLKTSLVRNLSEGRVQMLLKAEPIDIDVKDFPSENVPPGFSGFVGELQLQDSIRPPVHEGGEIIVTLRFEGTGNIRNLKLEDDSFGPDFEVRGVDEKTDPIWTVSGIKGQKTFNIRLAPKKTGQVTVPSISVSYWNLSKNAYETLTSNPMTIEVKRASSGKSLLAEMLSSAPKVIFLLDMSGSMLSEDFQPGNRFIAAREAVAGFIERARNLQIGVNGFAKEVSTLVPVGLPSPAVAKSIYNWPQEIKQDGTSMGNAIYAAVTEIGQNRSGKDRIVVVSDGSGRSGSLDPLTAVDFAKQAQVTIDAVVLGKEGLVPFPVTGPDGSQKTVQVDVSPDEEVMKQIAQESGGKFYRAKDRQELKEALQQIQKSFAV